MSRLASWRKKSNGTVSLRSKFFRPRHSLLEPLEQRQMLTVTPGILGLSAGNSAIYDGNTFTLTATIDLDTTVTQVKFYRDSHANGVFDSGDALLGYGTEEIGTSNKWTLSGIPTEGSSPMGTGKQLFFAQVTNFASTPSIVIAVPAEILSALPVLEPIDNDQIIEGRRFVMTAKADLPPASTDGSTMTYSLTYLVGSTPTIWPTGVTFSEATGTMIWDAGSDQIEMDPYHFQITATDGSDHSSAPVDFYLTVKNGSQYLNMPASVDSGAFVSGIGPFNADAPIFYTYDNSESLGTSSTSASIDPSRGSSAPAIPTAAAGASQQSISPQPAAALPAALHPGATMGAVTGSFDPWEGSSSADYNSTSTMSVLSGLTYNTATDGTALVEADVPIGWLSGTAFSEPYLSAQAELFDRSGTSVASGSVVYYTTAGLSGSGDHFHLALPVNTSLVTGEYKVEVHLTFLNSGGTAISTQNFGSSEDSPNAQVAIVNRTESEVGNRWAIAGLGRLVAYSGDGVMLIDGSGTTHWFAYHSETDSYQAEADTNLQLEVFHDSTSDMNYFRLVAPNSAYEQFDMTTGNLLARVDMLGNTTTYTYYSSSEGTGAKAGALESITDPTGRTNEIFTYDSSGMLAGITDFAGRITTLEYDDSGRLTQITKADESTQTFTYDDTTNLLKSQTNELGQTTSYQYDGFGRLARTIMPDGSSQILQSSDTNSLAQRVVVTYDGSTPIYLGSHISFDGVSTAAPLVAWNIDNFGADVGNHAFVGATGRMVDSAGNITHFSTDLHFLRSLYPRLAMAAD